ncbi:MAG: DUF4249 domain-containing protein [Flavisolibacter sp.]
MKKTTLFFFLSLLLTNCRDPYDIPINPSDKSLLVVEGVLNSGTGATRIILSKSSTNNQPYTPQPELDAKLVVEGKDNSIQSLTETGGGIYGSSQLTLQPDMEYRLKIITINGKAYASDYVKVLNTPPIDSVSWKKENDGITIYVNTHDPSSDAGYYQWDYEETWEHHATYHANYKWNPSSQTIVPMLPGEDFFYCWSSNNSKNLLLGSSSQFQTDMIHEMPMTFIPEGSEKMNTRYSILVHQRRLDKTGYEYLQLMKKNTEQLGSIFDPQPSELRGNIHCLSNPEESVIGYLTASSLSEQRIFITSTQAGWSNYDYCTNFEIPNDPDSVKSYIANFYLPFDADRSPGGGIAGWYFSESYCVDCRVRGGITVKPAFW